MAKKKRSDAPLFSPVFYVITILTIIVFAGLSVAFAFVQGEIRFDNTPDSARELADRVNPDATLAAETLTAITANDRTTPEVFTDLITRVNTARTANGLQPLMLNRVLNEAAGQQADHMASIRQVTHADANGTGVDSRVTELGYVYGRVAENLLSNWSVDGDVAYEQWWQSPPHRANMMSDHFTEMGLAYRVTSFGQVYFAMVLATPQ